MEEKSATFVFIDEDHTLGNALKYFLVQDKDVEFTGYTVPHPAERKMNLRIQTKNGTAHDALQRAGENLREFANCFHTKFSEAIELYESKKQGVSSEEIK